MSNQNGAPPSDGPPLTGYEVPPVPPSAYPQQGYPPPPGRGTNGMAIASLVVSIHGFGIPVAGVVGAVLGHKARRQIAETGQSGRGFATAGAVIGWISTGYFALIVVAVVLSVLFGN